ncbi:hypothetical protein Daus18300_002228 [Diaporthe australafricana]|uniref:Uncharacterized protein n=1 Tax=Diaporthe australafricana TaxID=127596 RepID=A0ABR3XQ71_9PEZI
MKWVFVTLLVPDTVLVIALGEYMEAIELQSRLRQLKIDMNDQKMPDYNLSFCFFVIMGGFEVSMEELFRNDKNADTPQVPPRMPLSPRGFLHMMKFRREEFRQQSFHMINEPASLADKNKATVFQKILVITQVLWMVLQIIFRKVDNLPISLPELHVAVHVLFAVITYVFWFKKPMDIAEPELLSPKSKDALGFLSLAIESQLCSCRSHTMPLKDMPEYQAVLGAASPNGPDTPRSDDNAEQAYSVPMFSEDGLENEFIALAERRISGCPTRDEIRRDRAILYLRDYLKENLNSTSALIPHPNYKDCFSVKGKLAPQKIQSSTRIDSILFRLSLLHSAWLGENDPRDYYLSPFIAKTTILVGGFSTLCYGAIHLAARKFAFPSAPERTFWYIASISMCVIAPIGHFIRLLFQKFDDPRIKQSERLYKWLGIVANASVIFIAVLSLASRIYIIGEAFISIRALPIGTFSMPVWLKMMPHL